MPYVDIDEEDPAAAAPSDPAVSEAVASAPPEPAELPLSASGRPMRRTSRGKPAEAPSAPARPAPPRRPRPTAPPTFGGLTLHALELLTKKNTARNQSYYATLETEIVRRAGERPESPGMKVRTIRQRQQDEAERGRAERAERRARRDGSGASDATGDDDGTGDDGGEEEEEDDDVLPALDLGKHVRGAGEEEDYETPTKPPPPAKKSRFGFADGGEDAPRRRIRWDRALFSVAYMDEIELGSRSLNRGAPDGKGCLAPKAKVRPRTARRSPQHSDHPHNSRCVWTRRAISSTSRCL
jgi:hypothetical protein